MKVTSVFSGIYVTTFLNWRHILIQRENSGAAWGYPAACWIYVNSAGLLTQRKTRKHLFPSFSTKTKAKILWTSTFDPPTRCLQSLGGDFVCPAARLQWGNRAAHYRNDADALNVRRETSRTWSRFWRFWCFCCGIATGRAEAVSSRRAGCFAPTRLDSDRHTSLSSSCRVFPQIFSRGKGKNPWKRQYSLQTLICNFKKVTEWHLLTSVWFDTGA